MCCYSYAYFFKYVFSFTFVELFPIILGVLTGILTGLLPGIHVNLVLTLVLVNFALVTSYFSPVETIPYVISLGITHTFIDYLPNAFFLLPDSDVSLALYPAQKLLEKGKAMDGVFLSSLGSFSGIILGLVILPLLMTKGGIIYNIVRPFLKWILLFLLLLFIIREPKRTRVWAAFVVLISGALGLLALNSYVLDYKLTVVFSGLFGAPALFLSILSKVTIPRQEIKISVQINRNFLFVGLLSSVVSLFTSIFPGVGNSQAVSVLAIFFKRITSKLFIFGVSVINTLNFILSLAVFVVLGRVRSGAGWYLQSLSNQEALSFIASDTFFHEYSILIIIVGLIGFVLTNILGVIFSFIFNKIQSLRVLFIFLLFFLVSLIYYLSGFIGIAYFIASFSIGMVCNLLTTRRVHLMAVLIVPLLFYL